MSGRGGRGGGRGGRGGGRSGGRDMPMGNVSFQEMQDSMRTPQQLNNRSSDILPTLAPTTSKELRDAVFQLNYLRHQRFSPYWPTLNASKSTSASGTKAGAATDAQASSSGISAAKPSLKDVKLQKEVFPQDVWRVYMDGENRRAQRAARRQARAKVDWTLFDAAGAGEAAGAGDAANEGGVGADSAEEMDDYEDEVDDDYNQNYFDPGDEDVDEGDDGGDEGGGTYE